jgi:hypothetical protein
MSTTYGLTVQGFVAKPQQVIIEEINASLQNTFGANINLGAESVFGQMVGIFSEREALIWQLAEAVYSSQYPTGAEGVSVDNILALNNQQRAKAKPTKTAATPIIDLSLITLNGLVLYGVPGTIVPKDSLIDTTASPAKVFKLDAAVTIGSPANCVQSIFLSSVPDSGNYTLSFTRGPKQAGNVFKDTLSTILTTSTILYNALTNQAKVSFSASPTSGTFKFTLTRAGTASVTAFINWNDNAATIQGAIAALIGYSGVTVSGTIAAGLTITYGAISQPILTVTNNTLSNGSPVTATVIDSVQAVVNNLLDGSVYPFTDVACSGFVTGLLFTFGSLTAIGSNPTNYNQPQPIIKQASNTMLTGITVVNMNIVMTTTGVGIGDLTSGVTVGAATCNENGPNFVAAGTLTVIGTPTSGWSGVYNELDCTTGSNAATDTQALQTRSTLLAAQANGPLQSIVEKVLQVPNVIQAKGFANLTDAAQQTVTWASVPGSGHWRLQLGAEQTTNINFDDGAALIQSHIRSAITELNNCLVTGDYTFGFVIDPNGSNGNQSVGILSIVSNTTGVVATVAFGRPPHSFEIVVEGGSDQAIAQAIYGSEPAGIGSYGSTTVQIFDAFNNPINISFSRPIAVPIYVSIALTTDIYNTPGDSGSGVNPQAKFNPQSISTIQNDIITIGDLVDIGGIVIGFGTDGLIGAFNNIPGIVSYTLFFGIAPNPVTNTNIQMQSEQVPLFETFNVIVSYV